MVTVRDRLDCHCVTPPFVLRMGFPHPKKWLTPQQRVLHNDEASLAKQYCRSWRLPALSALALVMRLKGESGCLHHRSRDQSQTVNAQNSDRAPRAVTRQKARACLDCHWAVPEVG